MGDLAVVDLVIEEQFHADARVVVMATTPSAGLLALSPHPRVRTFPISEPAMVGMAVGAAMTGLRPVVDLSRASFLPLVLDQLVNNAGTIPFLSNGQYQVPMVVVGVTRDDLQLGPQHEQTQYGMLMTIPGITVVVPGSLADLCGLLRTALDSPSPVVVLVDRRIEEQPGLKRALSTPPIPFGEAHVLSEGTDVTVVAIGAAVERALRVTDVAKAAGISCALIDPRTLAPLDVDTLVASIESTGRLVFVDDGPAEGAPHQVLGALSACPGVLARLGGRVVTIAAPNLPISANPALEALTRPTEAQILTAIEQVMA